MVLFGAVVKERINVKLLHRFSSEASGSAIPDYCCCGRDAARQHGHDDSITHFWKRLSSLRSALEINKNMLLWINDALMAVFFLLVGPR